MSCLPLRYLVASAALASIVACAPSSVTTQQPWRITALNGLVQIDEPDQPVGTVIPARDAKLEDAVQPGAIVITGAESMATITNGLELMKLSDNSRVAFPSAEKPGMTRVLQNMGSVLFQVDHRQSPHFSVETPLLAAIVKGTTFEVTVGAANTLVSVTEGLVQVQANASKQLQEVAKGYGGRVEENVPQTVVLVTPKELQQARESARISAAAAKTVGNPTALRGRAALNADLADPTASLPGADASGGAASSRPKASAKAASLLKDRGPVQVEQRTVSASGPTWTSETDEEESDTDDASSNGMVLQVILYGGGVAVAWFVIMAGYIFIRASLRDPKDKPKKSPTKKDR